MIVPEYVSKDEVQRVCKELGLSDWTAKTRAEVSPNEAAVVRKAIGGEAERVSLEIFQKGLEVELEHGVELPAANVTNNHPLLTGRIVVAHLKESLQYYQRLDVAELEGDLFKALQAGSLEKARSYFERLAAARKALAEAELAELAHTRG